MWLACSNINVDIDHTTMVGNTAQHRSTGGNLAVFYRNRTNVIINTVTVRNCYISNGQAFYGGGMYASILVTPSLTNHNEDISQVLHIENTFFTNNSAGWEGGALYIIVHERLEVYYLTGQITIQNCTFSDNSPLMSNGGGVAVHLPSYHIQEFLKHGVPQFEITFINCRFF